METRKAQSKDQSKDQRKDPSVPPPPPTRETPVWARVALNALGVVMVAIGVIGIFVPVLPTTVFLIVALWAFSRSSPRFQHWLWYHAHLGPPVRDWHHHRAIGVRPKVLAVIVMSLSFAYVTIWIAEDWKLPTLLAAILLPAGIYVVTRPHPPHPQDANPPPR